MNMKNTKRQGALALAVVLAAGILAGCATGGPSPAPGTNPADAPTGGSNPGQSQQGAITVISREEGSGTRGAFVEILGVVDSEGDDATVQTAEIVNATSVVSQTVAGNKAAIGYVSMGAMDGGVKALAVSGVEATVEQVKAGAYPVSRPFNLCYRADKITDLGKDFLTFIQSAEGQAILAEKYIAVQDNAPAYTPAGLGGNLSLNGSTSVGPVMMELAEAYMARNEGVTIDVQQTGSGAGITATIDGTCEIGMSSRDLKEEELAEGLTSERIALDGIAVIVNPENPVDNLSKEQIRDIFLGQITDWSELS